MAMMMLIHKHAFTLIFSFLLVQSVLSADPPESSPSPSPGPSTGPLSPPPPEAGVPFSPSPSPELDSPLAPPPSTPGSSPAPAPAPAPYSSNSSSPAPSPAPAPVPAPDVESDVNHESADSVSRDGKDSSGGMTGSQKAGVAFGVIAGACIVIFGGVLYKKRRDNIRRSQYGYGARREIL